MKIHKPHYRQSFLHLVILFCFLLSSSCGVLSKTIVTKNTVDDTSIPPVPFVFEVSGNSNDWQVPHPGKARLEPTEVQKPTADSISVKYKAQLQCQTGSLISRKLVTSYTKKLEPPAVIALLIGYLGGLVGIPYAIVGGISYSNTPPASPVAVETEIRQDNAGVMRNDLIIPGAILGTGLVAGSLVGLSMIDTEDSAPLKEKRLKKGIFKPCASQSEPVRLVAVSDLGGQKLGQTQLVTNDNTINLAFATVKAGLSAWKSQVIEKIEQKKMTSKQRRRSSYRRKAARRGIGGTPDKAPTHKFDFAALFKTGSTCIAKSSKSAFTDQKAEADKNKRSNRKRRSRSSKKKEEVKKSGGFQLDWQQGQATQSGLSIEKGGQALCVDWGEIKGSRDSIQSARTEVLNEILKHNEINHLVKIKKLLQTPPTGKLYKASAETVAEALVAAAKRESPRNKIEELAKPAYPGQAAIQKLVLNRAKKFDDRQFKNYHELVAGGPYAQDYQKAWYRSVRKDWRKLKTLAETVTEGPFFDAARKDCARLMLKDRVYANFLDMFGDDHPRSKYARSQGMKTTQQEYNRAKKKEEFGEMRTAADDYAGFVGRESKAAKNFFAKLERDTEKIRKAQERRAERERARRKAKDDKCIRGCMNILVPCDGANPFVCRQYKRGCSTSNPMCRCCYPSKNSCKRGGIRRAGYNLLRRSCNF